ncbi:MAG: DUF192 domain-containing protein [Treponema sp.]
MRSKCFFLAFLFSLILISCFAAPSFEKQDIFFIASKLENKQVSINVELAITPEQKSHGFMERKNIPEGTGMMFLYDRDEKLYFWMKDTPTPLSIAFIDSNGLIKEIKDMNPYSLKTIESALSVRYALEVPRGMFKRLQLEVGDSLSKESLLLLKRSVAKK